MKARVKATGNLSENPTGTNKVTMKARVKATGETIEVKPCGHKSLSTKHNVYIDNLYREYVDLQLDFSTEIDWEQRRYELAKEAMGAFIASPSYQFYVNNNYYEASIATAEYIAKDAVNYADALIAELRKPNPDDEFSSIVEQAPSLHKALEEIVSLPIPEPMTWKAFSDRVRNIALSAIGKCK